MQTKLKLEDTYGYTIITPDRHEAFTLKYGDEVAVDGEWLAVGVTAVEANLGFSQGYTYRRRIDVDAGGTVGEWRLLSLTQDQLELGDEITYNGYQWETARSVYAFCASCTPYNAMKKGLQFIAVRRRVNAALAAAADAGAPAKRFDVGQLVYVVRTDGTIGTGVFVRTVQSNYVVTMDKEAMDVLCKKEQVFASLQAADAWLQNKASAAVQPAPIANAILGFDKCSKCGGEMHCRSCEPQPCGEWVQCSDKKPPENWIGQVQQVDGHVYSMQWHGVGAHCVAWLRYPPPPPINGDIVAYEHWKDRNLISTSDRAEIGLAAWQAALAYARKAAK